MVCYAVTPDPAYRRMAAASAYSVAVTNPGTAIRIVEVDPPASVREAGPGHIMAHVKPFALPEDSPSANWVLFLDADTTVQLSLSRLTRRFDEADRRAFWEQDFVSPMFYGRPETSWVKGRVDRTIWRDIFRAAEVAEIPLFNAGAFLCTGGLAGELIAAWRFWAEWVIAQGFPDPVHLDKRPAWWMLDAISLTLAVGDETRVLGTVHYWDSREHSFQWESEPTGIIHHWSTSRWKDPFVARPAECAVVSAAADCACPGAATGGRPYMPSVEDR